MIILGDLNANMMSNSKLPKKDKQKLLNFSRTFDLTQLIKEPTRITDTSRTLIDLIFVNNDHRIVKSGVIPVRLSDHYLVFCILKAGVFIKAQPRLSIALTRILMLIYLTMNLGMFRGTSLRTKAI